MVLLLLEELLKLFVLVLLEEYSSLKDKIFFDRKIIYSLTSNTASTSTAAPSGKELTLTAALACLPFSGVSSAAL